MSNNKTNKWKLVDGKLIKTNEGKTASDIVQNLADTAFNDMEQPIVDSLAAKDASYIKARRERMAESIDKKRIANQIKALNEEKQNFIDFLLEAGRKVDNEQKQLAEQSIEVEIVEVKSFDNMLAASLGGALTSTPNQKQIEGSEFNELDDIMS